MDGDFFAPQTTFYNIGNSGFTGFAFVNAYPSRHLS